MENEAQRALRLLDLAPGASLADLKRAYRDLMLVWHPDRMPERLKALATEKVKALNQAYEYLECALEAGAPGPSSPSFEDEVRERLDQLLTVLQLACPRCGGAGTLAGGVAGDGHFLPAPCPACEGVGTLICLAASRCQACGGTGRNPEASAVPRAEYIRQHLGRLEKGTRAYRLRYRRLWVRHERVVTLCTTCSGAGFTFSRPDRRKGQGGRRRAEGGTGPRGDRRRADRRRRPASPG
jgi:DnaJ-class molecular chaperone